MNSKRVNSQQYFSKIARCPVCRQGDIHFEKAIALCTKCHSWYPIINGILELVPMKSAYIEDRKTIWKRFSKKYHLKKDPEKFPLAHAQKNQRKHFDWYVKNLTQTYTMYEKMRFWKIVDRLQFEKWKKILPKNPIILDVGCAQGRSLSAFLNSRNTIIGFDISKNMIEEGNRRFNAHVRPPYLFVGDATVFPISDESIDVVMFYGVLHHVPNPELIVQEIIRVLKPGGLILLSENNNSPLRIFFDLFQKINSLWYEEAGDHPMLSSSLVHRWFANSKISLSTTTHIFVPPHIINMLPTKIGRLIIQGTDAVASWFPFAHLWGGLIEIIGRKEKNHKFNITPFFSIYCFLAVTIIVSSGNGSER